MKLWIGVGVALPPKAKESRTLVWWTGVEVVYFKQLFCLQIVCCSTNTTKYSCKPYKCKNINPLFSFQNSIEEGIIETISARIAFQVTIQYSWSIERISNRETRIKKLFYSPLNILLVMRGKSTLCAIKALFSFTISFWLPLP